jgi:two-component system cell cycle sensor histidine kinase/response regulator CckA
MNRIPDVAGQPKHILIVDDERNDRVLLELLLAPLGYSIRTAASGEEALSMVAADLPDLILLDIILPGMSGHDVATQLKATPASMNVPIIMVTALDDRKARMLGLLAGAEEFLTKPVDQAELSIRVRNLLRLKAYGDHHDSYSRLLEGEVGSRTADIIESESLYRSTFDAAPVGIVHLSLGGRWVRVNQRMSDLLGYSRAELEAVELSSLMQHADLAADLRAIGRMIGGLTDRNVVDERRYQRRDGTFVWGRVNTSIFRDADGVAVHFISVIEDITERRTLEAQVRQASKMDAVGRLASGVAHDFNNLLTVILGFTQFIAEDSAPNTEYSTELDEIVKAAQRAAGLTRQLLAFSRQQVLYAAPIDVNGLITDMTGMLGRLIGEHIAVALTLAHDVAPALVDQGQLEQVVMNLVVNARDAMPLGGRINISTANVRLDGSLSIGEEVVAGDYVSISVTDEGTGMSSETRRRIFEPFFTTKEAGKGTGLGLSTTYGIVKQSKGYVTVRSELERGTTFTVYLPRSASLVPALTARVARTVTLPCEARTILLVEDEDAVRKLSARMLEKAGYHVLQAENGDQATTVFNLHAPEIALVLTDVIMPGCSGPELFQRLRVKRPGLRVVYMSGYSEQADVHMMGSDGSHPFVQKPFTSGDLITKVRETLEH